MSMRANLAICLTLVAALALPARSTGATLSEGSAAPALVATTLDGAAFDLGALRGKVVLINFWATWCPPCREEMPVIDRFYRGHHDEGLDVLAASIDDRHDRRDVVKFMRPFAFPAVLLTLASSNGWGSPDVMPMTYLVDRDGVIRAVIRPSKQTLTVEKLEELLKPLLHPTPSNTRQEVLVHPESTNIIAAGPPPVRITAADQLVKSDDVDGWVFLGTSLGAEYNPSSFNAAHPRQLQKEGHSFYVFGAQDVEGTLMPAGNACVRWHLRTRLPDIVHSCGLISTPDPARSGDTRSQPP